MFLTYSQARTHNCQSVFTREIDVQYFVEVPDSRERTIIAHGHDGVMYRIIEKRLTDESLQRKKTDKDFTESEQKILEPCED